MEEELRKLEIQLEELLREAEGMELEGLDQLENLEQETQQALNYLVENLQDPEEILNNLELVNLENIDLIQIYLENIKEVE